MQISIKKYCKRQNELYDFYVTAKFHEVPPTPPPSLDDEIQLKYNRLFILPLIEANEASYHFDTNTHGAQH